MPLTRSTASSPGVRRSSKGLVLAGSLAVLAAVALVLLLIRADSRSISPASPKTVQQDADAAGPLVSLAEAAIERGDRTEASRLLDEALRRNPDSGMALLYRGQLARDRGDGDAALTDWRRVENEPPKIAATARYLEGTLMLERGYARRAETLFRRSATLNPAYLQPQQRLLELYVSQVRRDDVRRQIEKVERSRPLLLQEFVFRLVPPERATTPEAGASVMQTCYEQDPEDVASAVALAVFLIEGEKHQQAAEIARDVLTKSPHHERAAALLAEALLRTGDHEAARTSLERFPPSESSAAALWRSHGHLAEASGDWQHAASCLRRVVETEPEDSASLYRLGVIEQHLGRSDESRRLLKRSAVMDRMQREALRLIWGKQNEPELMLPIIVNVAERLLELDYPVEAARWYQQALAMDSTNGSARSGLQQIAEAMSANPDIARRPDPFGPNLAHESRAADAVATTPLEPPTGSSQSVVVRNAPASPVVLHDVAAMLGLDHTYFNGNTGFKHLVESMGGGVAVLDYDIDGRPDVYFPQGCAIPPDLGDQTHRDRLFRNSSGGFENVSDKAGIFDNRYGQGVTVGDYDSDGFDDVVVANYGRNTLYHNNGDGTFADVTADAGLDRVEEMSSSLAFADLDLDGDLDLYVANYVTSLKVCPNDDGTYGACNPTNFDAQQDRLYRNDGEGTFEDVTSTSGVIAADGKGLGVVAADLDDDGRTDLYVANDTTPNFLFLNVGGNGALQFSETGLTSGSALNGEGRSQAGMGVATADFNDDGFLDLHVTNFYQETNTLYLNLGGGVFEDATRRAGLAEPSFDMLGFGTQAADFDLDSRADLFVANGHIDDFGFRGEPWKMRPQLYSNKGNAEFVETSNDAGPYFTGQYLGRGVARLDFDQDGRPDLAVVHQDRPAGLLHNETEAAGHAVVVELHGVASNRDAIGAKIVLTADGTTQTHQVCGGDGFFSSNEKRLFIGVGRAEEVEHLEIRWPGGHIDHWNNLPTNRRVTCVEGRTPTLYPLAERMSQR